MIIQEAKFVIEEARKAGADRVAQDDYAAARSWLSQAEKAYEGRKSFFAGTQKAREEEVIYLGTMAKLKGLTAEAKTKKNTTLAQLKNSQRELADYRDALEVLKKKVAEVEKAKEVQATAEAERRALEDARRKTAELEEWRRRELEEAQRRAVELEALKQRELQAARLEQATRLSQRERELAEAKMKSDQMAWQQAKEAAELKAREERIAAERERIAALQKKAEALERETRLQAEKMAREKTLLTEAAKIPQATVKTGDKEVVITILAINLFSPSIELTPSGKGILDGVGTFLNQYPGHKVVVRGHTDNVGSEAINKTVSEKRAERVREYLVDSQNVNPAQITTEALGPSQPVATNDNEAGRALNRRVEIAVQTGD